jgi:hypothetical protein
VIQVRGQPGGERYAGEQAKNKIDRVGPKDKRPIAQGESKSLNQDVGEGAVYPRWLLPWGL